MLTEEMRDRKTTISYLASPVTLLPQVTKNMKVTSKSAVVSDPEVQAKFEEINNEIHGRGRALLRQSGTEPVIRIMMECETEKLCESYIDKLASVIRKRGYCCD